MTSYLEWQFIANYEEIGAIKEEYAKGCDARYVKTENGIKRLSLSLSGFETSSNITPSGMKAPWVGVVPDFQLAEK